MSERKNDEFELDKIKGDITALRKDFGKLLDHLRVGTVKASNGQMHRLQDMLNEGGERSVELIAAQIEQRPLTSLLVAFGVGFIGGRFLNHRN